MTLECGSGTLRSGHGGKGGNWGGNWCLLSKTRCEVRPSHRLVKGTGGRVKVVDSLNTRI